MSRLLLETRAAEERTGTAVEISGGKLLRCDEIARPVGTTITVRDLFFNVPARKNSCGLIRRSWRIWGPW